MFEKLVVKSWFTIDRNEPSFITRKKTAYDLGIYWVWTLHENLALHQKGGKPEKWKDEGKKIVPKRNWMNRGDAQIRRQMTRDEWTEKERRYD